ncbi:MAG: SemiSWEET family sugar transporter [Hyphomicrobiaceae bacterium]
MWSADNLSMIVGTLAALCTTACNFPQVIKVHKTQETHDLSVKMLLLLNGGLGLWITYGLLKQDWLIAGSNLIGLSLTSYLLWKKLRAGHAQR